MSVLPYLAGLAGAVALVITLLLTAYCLLYPIGARATERDAFCDPEMVKAAQKNRQRYTVFGYRKRSALRSFIQWLLSTLLFRRT